MSEFRKGTRPKDVPVIVPDPWDGEGRYTLYFTKRPPREAMDAGEAYFAATGEERAEERRKSLVRAAASLMTREPEGFADFPRDERPLSERALEYFDDPEEIDLEKILSAAWSWYLSGAAPRAYSKSTEDSLPPVRDPSGVSE